MDANGEPVKQAAARLLLEQRAQWLPSARLGRTPDLTSSRVEGVNSRVKVALGHERVTLAILVECIVLLSEMFMNRSRDCRPRVVPADVLSSQIGVGNRALGLINDHLVQAQAMKDEPATRPVPDVRLLRRSVPGGAAPTHDGASLAAH